MSKSKNNSIKIGDDHKWLVVQRQKQKRIVLAVYNKHLMDSDADCATILLDAAQIMKLRNECNTALDWGLPE